jgi:type III secretory pathway lipoprotein EscJ
MRRHLLLLFLLGLTSCKEEILHDLSEAQANQVWIALEKRQIKVLKEKTISAWAISVQQSDALKSLQILQELKLPHGLWREKDSESSSIIPSKEDRQLNRERQLAKSIEGSLLSLPAVSDAHVHLVIPLGDSISRGTASVLVVSENSNSLQPQQFRDLVAGASSIPKELVAVTIVNSQEYSQKAKLELPVGVK